jgi:hypothetical protein
MMQQRRAARREAELEARLAQSWPLPAKKQNTEKDDQILKKRIQARQQRFNEKLAKEADARRPAVEKTGIKEGDRW